MLITADKIHDGNNWLPNGTIIEIDELGTIIALHGSPREEVIHYEGILCPGFVNVHCHMELSHMKGIVPEHIGLMPFLKHIPTLRDKFTEEQKISARQTAYREMVQNGIVAVGDIANTTDSLDVRAMEEMHVHTFVESIGFTEEKAEMMMGFSIKTYEAFEAQQAGGKLLRQSIVPHAPYSVSPSLFRLINAHKPKSLISIHNQESEAEHQFYHNKEGAVNELLAVMGISTEFFQPSGKSSLQTYTPYFDKAHNFIFVHNTYTGTEDAHFGHGHFAASWWCLCPNANIYIEDRLPDIPMLMSEQRNICIGTDSLASNHQLSVLAELQTINQHYPEIGWETLLRWGTSNGAKALRMNDVIGNLTPGMSPGIVNINNSGTAKKVA